MIFEKTFARNSEEEYVFGVKRKIFFLIFILAISLGLGVSIRYYTYVFATTVDGEVSAIERVIQQDTIITSGAQGLRPDQIFSFAVSIRDKKGVYHTSSSEDRQWAVVQKGQCVQARFFPYPPWELGKSGTYHNARLLHVFDCASNPQK